MNGKIKTLAVIVLAMATSCSSKIRYSNFQYLDVVEKNIEKSTGKDINEAVLLTVMEVFEDQIVAERDEDWDRRIYYLPSKGRFFELKLPELVFQKYLEEKLDRVDIMHPEIEMEGSDYGSWRNMNLLQGEIQLLKEPDMLVANGDRRCETEIGYAFTITPVYKTAHDKYFFVIQFGRRKYCLNSRRNVIDAFVGVPGHKYPFMFFVCFNAMGDVWVKNYSF